ncbi:MAG: nitroreductase family protein [Lachnospiraceae bacterium]|nr:nitroreductase family protein [Lachnospiraceae bacterium]
MAETNVKKQQVIIDKEKCIGCGLCKKDCVGCDIAIVDGKADAAGNSCILCGHCEAICPQGAIKITGYDDVTEEYDEQERLDPDKLLKAIKTRRTVRQFIDKPVPEKVVDMIFEAGRMAPTGTNSQSTSYVWLDEKKAECEAVAVGMFSQLIKAGKAIVPRLSNMEIDSNFFFKGAPLVIVIFGNDTVSASLAAENMAFMAEANGLGVLFSGFFTGCVNMSGKIRKIMGIDKKPKAVTTLVIGYPAVKYLRTPHRKALNMKHM